VSSEIPPYEERIKWFHQARFGIIVHWGLYSIPGRGEWVMKNERIPADEYAQLAKKFNPKKFDADEWAELAKEAGAKYMVFTTRHHDGFCLYDSKVSDFTSVKTAAKRDFVAEYVKAVRKAGLKVGLYYSLLDWRFPGFFDLKSKPDSAKAMVAQAQAQIEELMTHYGKIDYFWYDGSWIPGLQKDEIAEFWETKGINAMVRKLQPHILINNRSGSPEDIDSYTPASKINEKEPGRGWETSMPIGDRGGWGYLHNNPNMKSVTQLIQHLVEAAAGEGNCLLNIGPKPDGTVRKEEVDRLRAIGKWLSANGESIYGSERSPFDRKMLGRTTAKGNIVYAHVFHWPKQGEITFPSIMNKVKSATVLSTGQQARIETGSSCRTFLKDLPKIPPDPHVTVIKMVLDGKPEAGCWWPSTP